MKTEMAAKPHPKDKAESPKQDVVSTASPKDRRLAGLKAREANLKRKISERIPQFTEATRDQSLERAKEHLEHVQTEIKKAS